MVKSLVRLGYACINLSTNSKCNATCRLGTLEKLSTSAERLQLLIKKSKSNLLGILEIIEWNKKNEIYFYRLTSMLFPHISNP